MVAIRKSQEKDWRDLKQIRLESLKEAPMAFGTSFESAATISDKEWQDRAGNRMVMTYFMAYMDTHPIGLIGGVAGHEEYHIISMWVKPGYRRKGIAAQLLDVACSHARENGFNEAVLMVSRENTAASALYEKKGFRFVAHTEPLNSYPEIIIQKMVANLEA